MPTGEKMKLIYRTVILLFILPVFSCLTLASTAYRDRSVASGNPSSATYDGSMYRLSLECNQTKALVFLNGALYGQTDSAGYFTIKLRSGAYDVKVVKDGFQTYSRNIRLDRDRMIRFLMQNTTGNGNGSGGSK